MIDAQLGVLGLQSERVPAHPEPAVVHARLGATLPAGATITGARVDGRGHGEIDVALPYGGETRIAVGKPLADGSYAAALARAEELRETLEWWKGHNEEWQAIGQELIAAGGAPTAEEITVEQYRRMNDRGDSPFEARRTIDRLRVLLDPPEVPMPDTLRPDEMEPRS